MGLTSPVIFSLFTLDYWNILTKNPISIHKKKRAKFFNISNTGCAIYKLAKNIREKLSVTMKDSNSNGLSKGPPALKQNEKNHPHHP